MVGGEAPAAHHAVQAAFDQDDHATLTGVLTKVLWINPHVRWFLDVKDDSGKVTTWTISGAGPNGFRDIGISGRDVFKTGETYTAIVARPIDKFAQRLHADLRPAGRPEDRPLAPVQVRNRQRRHRREVTRAI